MKMTNVHNLMAYRRWAPIYDTTLNRLFTRGRKRALYLLNLQPGEKVLIPGVGTGADFPYLPAGVQAAGIDLSPDMLAKARTKLATCHATVQLIQGDAQENLVPVNSYDAAILNLVLSVVPDGHACLQATLRAVKSGGRLVIFDKFQPDDEKVKPGRCLMNFFSTRIGTDITRHLGDILAGCSCEILQEETCLPGGMYRVILLRKR